MWATARGPGRVDARRIRNTDRAGRTTGSARRCSAPSPFPSFGASIRGLVRSACRGVSRKRPVRAHVAGSQIVAASSARRPHSGARAPRSRAGRRTRCRRWGRDHENDRGHDHEHEHDRGFRRSHAWRTGARARVGGPGMRSEWWRVVPGVRVRVGCGASRAISARSCSAWRVWPAADGGRSGTEPSSDPVCALGRVVTGRMVGAIECSEVSRARTSPAGCVSWSPPSDTWSLSRWDAHVARNRGPTGIVRSLYRPPPGANHTNRPGARCSTRHRVLCFNVW